MIHLAEAVGDLLDIDRSSRVIAFAFCVFFFLLLFNFFFIFIGGCVMIGERIGG